MAGTTTSWSGRRPPDSGHVAWHQLPGLAVAAEASRGFLGRGAGWHGGVPEGFVSGRRRSVAHPVEMPQAGDAFQFVLAGILELQP